MLKLIFSLLLALAAYGVQAAEARPVAADPALEARVQALSEELRCLVCQNQTLADSHAELAVDLKNQVREMLQKGLSDKEVINYMVTRYGDFVLYRPPVKGTTWLLWFGPFALFFGALGVLFFKIRQRRQMTARELTADEHAAAQQLLQGGEGRSSPVSAKGVRASPTPLRSPEAMLREVGSAQGISSPISEKGVGASPKGISSPVSEKGVGA